VKFPKLNCVKNERKVSSFTGEKSFSQNVRPNENYPLTLVHVHTKHFLFLGTKIFTLGDKKESSDRGQSTIFVLKKAPKLLPDF
jgi:hypothetical protein